MSEVREFKTTQDFFDFLKIKWGGYGWDEVGCPYDFIEVRPYGNGIDQRIGWNTYLVSINGKGIGFTDGPLPG